MDSTRSSIFKIVIGAILFVTVVMLAVGYSVLRANLQEKKAEEALEQERQAENEQAATTSAVNDGEEKEGGQGYIEMYTPPTQEELELVEEAAAREVAPPTQEELELVEEAATREVAPPTDEELVLLVKAALRGVTSPTEEQIVSTLKTYGALSGLSAGELRAVIEAVQRQ